MIKELERPATYGDIMVQEPAHIILNIDTKEPIAVGDFVSAFTSLAGQYDKFMREKYPDYKGEAQMFVREVRAGSIEADLIPWIMAGYPVLISRMDQILILDQFVRLYAGRITAYLKRGGKVEDATRSDLKHFNDGVAAIANDPQGSISLSAAYFEDGEKKVKVAFKFDTQQARLIQEHIEDHQRQLDRKDSAAYERMFMTFRQCNVRDVIVGKRSGETVIIEDINHRELPLIYASELAEQRIKHEIREAEDNVFKKGFIVDVSVQLKGGIPVAYRVTDLHQVIDLPDDEPSANPESGTLLP